MRNGKPNDRSAVEMGIMQPGEHIQVGRGFASINNISGSPRLRTMKVLCDQQGGDIAARMWQDVRGCSQPWGMAPYLLWLLPSLLLFLSRFYGQMQWHVSHSVCNINSLTCRTRTGHKLAKRRRTRGRCLA